MSAESKKLEAGLRPPIFPGLHILNLIGFNGEFITELANDGRCCKFSDLLQVCGTSGSGGGSIMETNQYSVKSYFKMTSNEIMYFKSPEMGTISGHQ